MNGPNIWPPKPKRDHLVDIFSKRRVHRKINGGIVAMLFASFFVASPLLADGIVNRQTQSSDYVRTLTRHASTNSLDSIVYNPAGVMKFENGTYAKLDSVLISKEYSNTIPGYGKFEDSNTIGFIPAFFALHKRDDWSVYCSFTVPGGGGIVDYDKGNATSIAVANGLMAATPLNTVDAMNVKASSVYFGYTLGGAYAINEKLSMAAGIRYVDANIDAESNLALSVNGFASRVFQIDFEQHAGGWGGFAGINISPSEKVNIGLVYQSNTRLSFDKDIHRDDINAVGTFAKSREDLPGLIGVGVGLFLRQDVRLDVNYTHYLEQEATWEGRLDGQGGSYDLTASAEYTLAPNLKINLGCRKTHMGIDPDRMGAESPELSSVTVSTGALWNPGHTWAVNLGVAKVFYDAAVTSQGTEYDKDAVALFFGVQKKFF